MDFSESDVNLDRFSYLLVACRQTDFWRDSTSLPKSVRALDFLSFALKFDDEM